MSTLYPFVRTESGPAPPVQPAVLDITGSMSATVESPTMAAAGTVAAGGVIIGTIAATVTSPTAAFVGSTGSSQFLPGYLEYFGIFNQDYLTGETRTQFASHIL